MSQQVMTNEQMQALILKLTQENEMFKAAQVAKMYMKVSEKGAVSLYGINRLPVTLYKAQWARILDNSEMIRKFIQENESQLATKA